MNSSLYTVHGSSTSFLCMEHPVVPFTEETIWFPLNVLITLIKVSVGPDVWACCQCWGWRDILHSSSQCIPATLRSSLSANSNPLNFIIVIDCIFPLHLPLTQAQLFKLLHYLKLCLQAWCWCILYFQFSTGRAPLHGVTDGRNNPLEHVTMGNFIIRGWNCIQFYRDLCF